MSALLLAFAVSFAITMGVIRWASRRPHLTHDRNASGPQKFHFRAVPRIGGLAVFLALAVGATALSGVIGVGAMLFALTLLACAAPAFLAGFIQDFTEAISPRGRLAATSLSAGIAFFWMGAGLRETSIPGLDWVVTFTVGSLLLTVFAVAGIANAINIIDGFNGLASMCVMLMLCAVAYVAFQVDDRLIGLMALAGIGAVLGFFLWNFPSGLIFLGDGGAYFLGFYVAELSILLLNRNAEVSPFFPLLVCIYPVFETVFSIYRRRFLRARPPHMPDGIHLHSLIYRRVMRWAVGERSAKALTRRNSMTSPVLWALCMASVVPAVLFWDNTALLASSLVLFALSYVLLYWRIVRFRSPRWLRSFASRPAPLPRGDNRRT